LGAFRLGQPFELAVGITSVRRAGQGLVRDGEFALLLLSMLIEVFNPIPAPALGASCLASNHKICR
jgi:hypothetical protein